MDWLPTMASRTSPHNHSKERDLHQTRVEISFSRPYLELCTETERLLELPIRDE